MAGEYELLKMLQGVEEEQQRGGFLEGLLSGARGTAADITGGLLTVAAPFAGMPRDEVQQVLSTIRGPERELSGAGQIGSIIGSAALLAPTGLAIERGIAGLLGGGRSAGAIAGGLTGAAMGAFMGDPDRSAAEMLLHATIGGGLGTIFGAALPVLPAAKTAPLPGVSTLEAMVPSAKDPIMKDPTMLRYATRTLIGALSGGVIGGLWLPDPLRTVEDEYFFSPGGALAGAALSMLSAWKGAAAAQQVRKAWDALEGRFLGGLGPIKQAAKEGELLRIRTAEETFELLRSGMAEGFTKEDRALMNKAIDGFVAAHQLTPDQLAYARQAVEHTHRIFKKLVELGAVDPARMPPERFVDGIINEVTGYAPQLYRKGAEKAAAFSIRGDIAKQAKDKMAEIFGSVAEQRGVMKPLSEARKKFPQYEKTILNPRKAKIGDTFFDGEHTWTIIKSPTKRGTKVLWRDFTEEEMERAGRQWDIFLGLAKVGQEHSRILADATVFKAIADNPALATASKEMAEANGWVFVEDAFTKGGFKLHGALNGKWVRPDVAEALTAYREMNRPPSGPVYSLLRSINSNFKKTYLGYNYASYKNAILGNLVLGYMHGYNPFRILREGIKAMRDADFMQELRQHGLAMMHGMDLDTRTIADMVEKAERVGTSFPIRFLGMLNETTRRIIDGGISLYGKIDVAYKAGLARMLQEKGVPLERAVARANEVFISSELVPRRIAMLRDTVMPFITFYYRFLEHTLPEVVRNPHRLLALSAIVDALHMASLYDEYGPNWHKGFKYEQEVAPFYLKAAPFTMSNYVRGPDGYYSLSFIPTHLSFTMPASETMSVAMATVLQNPVLSSLWSLMSGRDPSTDVPVGKLQAMMKTAPKPWPPKLLNAMVQEGLFPDKMLAWFNFISSHHKDLARTPVEIRHVLWDAFFPTYHAGDEYSNFMRHYMSIQESLNDRERWLRAKMKGGVKEAPALLKQLVEERKEATEKVQKATRLRHAAKEVVPGSLEWLFDSAKGLGAP